MSARDIRAGVRRVFRLALTRPELAGPDADDELDALMAARIEYLVARGMSAETAQAEAQKHLGETTDAARARLHNSAGHREKRLRLAERLDELLQDVRFTARTLVRSPGFAITAIVVTALGIGANTAAFSVADFVLLRPLPFANPDRLVKLWESTPGYDHGELSPPIYRDWKAMTTSYEAMAAFHPTAFNLTGRGEPDRLTGVAVTANLLPLLGVKPALGRVFAPGEEGTAMLSNALWQRTFGGDSSAVGGTVVLDGVSRVVIGVMPAEFRFPNREVALWTPMTTQELSDDDRGNNWFEVVARLKRGVTLEQARTELNVVAARLDKVFPTGDEKVGGAVFALRDEFSRQSRLLLIALCGAALCVLLLSCANLAGLIIARSLARRRELDVRVALGAGRARLVRQLMTESLVIASLGGALGIVLAIVSVPLLTRLVPAALPVVDVPAIDLHVLLFAGLATTLTGIGMGVLPARRASGQADLGALREGARSGGGQRLRLRSALVIAEVMASVVLLVSAGLLMRALIRLNDVDPGFRAERVLTLRTALPFPPYDSTARRVQFYTQVLTGVRALSGVENAGYITGLPMAMTGGLHGVSFPGQSTSRAPGSVASVRYATPGYFPTMRIRLRVGRDIEETDAAGAPFVAVVSESFMRRFLPGEEGLGKRFQIDQHERTIVGIVGDVRVRGLERESEPQVYLSYKQVDDGNFTGYIPKDLVIRLVPGTSSVSAIMPSLREIVHTADPLQPISNVRTMEEIVAETTASRTVQVRVIGAFAIIAFLLAAVGIHGLLADTVSQRRHEIGVRMALGAQRSTIVAMVMRQGVWLAVCGVVPGIVLAYAAGRAMSALLAGVAPGDIATFLAATVLCVLMTLAGSLVPVLRAVNVAPASAFRSE
ncbi:MAG: ABC transporter permease [bacterium]